MPSLPTSLILVGLVVAWLVVLVPMVAKRRDHVPESDDDSATFRVVHRTSRVRRRPVMSRTAMAARDADSGGADMDGISDDDDGADVADDARGDDDGDSDGEVDDAPDSDGRVGDIRADDNSEARGVAADLDEAPDADSDVPARRSADRVLAGDDAAASGSYRDEGWYRPVPARPGRGGYDPQVAEGARAYRFRRRRRVALVLLAVTLLGAGAGALGFSSGWLAACVAGVLLVLYLAYLRRQVRIEAEIQERRAARFARARQIRPGYRPSVAEQVWMHRTGQQPRVRSDGATAAGFRAYSHVRGTVPPAAYLPGEPVDLDDSDPAFDELEYYQPEMYRRRAG